MIIIFKVLLILLILSLLIDLYLKLTPKSKLKIKPINCEIKENNIKCEFKILNSSFNKETMIPNLNIRLDFFENNKLVYRNYEKEIIISDGNLKRNINNYWPTTIIKSNSSIHIYIHIKLKEYLENKDLIWLNVNWQNYGHFGLIKRENCFLINNYKELKKDRNVIKIPLNDKYEAIAIKTKTLGVFDNPIETTLEYCKDLVQSNDILVIGETPLAIMQGRYINHQEIRYSFYSKMLCYFFHPTSSLATASGMQLMINKIGITRIIFSLLIGLIFKLIGIKGVFYRLTGNESSLIDDISGTTPPYDKSIVLGPSNPKKYCDEVSNILKIDIAVADVNDLGGVKVLASSSKSIINLLKQNLKSNPAGNDDQKTPILLIRKK